MPLASRALFCLLLRSAHALLHQRFGAITYANRGSSIASWLDVHASTATVLGFDTETRPQFVKGAKPRPPATLQLATSDACLVVHCIELLRAERRWPPELLDVLGSSSVVKAGVSIDDDALELWLFYGVETRGRLDLGGVGAAGSRQQGLKSLAAQVLGFELPKKRSLTLANWERPLTEEMLGYAAADAWVGRAVVDRLAQLQPGGALGTPTARAGLIKDERPLAELYARRRARRAVRDALIALEQGHHVLS